MSRYFPPYNNSSENIKVEYTGLQSHFRSANYTAFIRRRDNFE